MPNLVKCGGRGKEGGLEPEFAVRAELERVGVRFAVDQDQIGI